MNFRAKNSLQIVKISFGFLDNNSKYFIFCAKIQFKLEKSTLNFRAKNIFFWPKTRHLMTNCKISFLNFRAKKWSFKKVNYWIFAHKFKYCLRVENFQNKRKKAYQLFPFFFPFWNTNLYFKYILAAYILQAKPILLLSYTRLFLSAQKSILNRDQKTNGCLNKKKRNAFQFEMNEQTPKKQILRSKQKKI